MQKDLDPRDIAILRIRCHRDLSMARDRERGILTFRDPSPTPEGLAQDDKMTHRKRIPHARSPMKLSCNPEDAFARREKKRSFAHLLHGPTLIIDSRDSPAAIS